MSEVQAHGIAFEDFKIRERTGLSKKDYDKLKLNGYTSPFDLVKGIIVDYNGSIKSTGKNSIGCADILKRMKETDYRLIVGCYEQKGNNKIFHTEYEFYVTQHNYHELWGNMTYEQIEQYVNFVKAIPPGKEAQKNTLEERIMLQERIQSTTSLMKINPKVDSKEQRRVQCSVKLDEMLLSNIKYTKKDINIIIPSSRRKFKK